jgi:hypothetical protein
MGQLIQGMAKRLSRLVIAIGFVFAALACLEPARRSISRLSSPHDFFKLSLVASGLLTLLFFAAPVATFRRSREEPFIDRRRTWLWNLCIAALIVALSATVIATEAPTSFVSWEQWRGAPLPWLENGHYYGPCFDGGGPCRTYWPMSLRSLALLINYGVIAAAVHMVRRLTTRCS